MTIPSIARVTIIGSVSSPAEVKYVSSGKPLTTFRVRVDEPYKDRSGAQQVRSSEHPITWWGDHVVSLGQLVYLEAKLSSRSYEARGETRWATEIVAEKVVPLGGDAAEVDTEKPGGSREHPRSAAPDPQKPAMDDSEIPF